MCVAWCMQQWYMKELYGVWGKYNSNPLLALIPILVNLPIFLGMYNAMLTMCNGGLPSLAIEDGLPWASNLAAVDPYHILNLAVPITLAVQFQMTALDGLEGMSADMRKYFLWFSRIMPIIMVPMMWNFQGALCLYWTYSNLYSISFAALLRVPAGALLFWRS